MKAGDLVGGKYRLIRRLGQGAMGVVWECTHEVTSRHVAMKLIVNATDNLRKRLLREARAAGQIAHRNVVEVYDIGESSDGDPFLVMQLLAGETLYACLKREGALDRARGLSILRDICRALVAAHAQGIVHRDLKPANVFLHREAGSEGEIVKVLDFGLCKPMGVDEMLTAPGGMLGSPAYMSPEQIMGAADLDPRTDLWALGVLVFEIVSGKRPFAGRGPDLIHAVLTDPIPRLSEAAPRIDPLLDEIVARSLAREREARWSSASEVLARLEGLTSREEQRALRQAPEPADNDEGELAQTLLFRPGSSLSGPPSSSHRVSKTMPLAAFDAANISARAPTSQPASYSRPPAPSQPEPAPPSGPSSSSSSPQHWSPPSRPNPADAAPMPMNAFHGTTPMPRMTPAQAQQWAAMPSSIPQAQQQPQQQPPQQPPGMGYPAPPGQNPMHMPLAAPRAAPSSKVGLFVGAGLALLVLVVIGLYLGLSRPTDAPPPAKPAGAAPAKPATPPAR